MIFKNGHEITFISKGNKTIDAVYKGGRLVWQAVRSCFGAGYWRNDKPWINNEAWRNK